MDKYMYINKKIQQLENKIQEYILNNNISQTLAKRMGADFTSTYEESYLWNQALFLTTNGCKVLLEEVTNKTALKSIHIAAQIYENLYYIAEKYDREYCILLSSICYDIAGYQANAMCLTSHLYLLKNTNGYNLGYENNILLLVQFLLQKKIQLLLIKSNEFLVNISEDKIVDINYKEGIRSFFVGMKNISLFILYGQNVEINKYLELSELVFLENGNIFLSLISLLVKTRYNLVNYRSTWNNLNNKGKLENNLWKKYLSLLSINMYNGNMYVPTYKRRSIFEFWNSQLEAINKGILDSGKGHIVQMPTSAGKTMIAELTILDSLTKYPDKKCIYIAPFRSLSYEIEESFSNRLGRIGYIITDAKGSYEKDEFDDYYLKEADVIISTPEKLNLLMRLNYEFFDNVSLVIIDEGHILGDGDKRAAAMEFLLIRLKRKLRNQARFIFLSAVMNTTNSQELSNWLYDTEEQIITSPLDYSNKEWQPTNRIIGKFQWGNGKGTILLPDIRIANEKSAFLPNIVSVKRYVDYTPIAKRKKTVFFPRITSGEISKSDTAAVLTMLYITQGPVLIFCSTKRNLYGIANSMLELIRLKEINGETDYLHNYYYRDNLESIEITKKWMGDCALVEFLKRGIGLHYGHLVEPVRKAIENDYRSGKLSTLISTNTLGQGVNLPIKTVVFHSLVINIQKEQYVSVRDFWNIIGRAGRAGKETEGNIIFICNSNFDEKLYNKYTDINNIEPVKSVIYLLIKSLMEQRLSGDDFHEYLRYFFESELLTILVEEGIEEIDNKIINDIIGDSLARAQIEEMDHTTLIEGLVNIANNFYTNIKDKNMRRSFAKTGLSLSSCNVINNSIETMLEDLEYKINDNYERVLDNIFECFSNVEEMQPEKKILQKLKVWENKDFVLNFISLWIKGTEINKLKEFWVSYQEDDYSSESMDVFIEEFLSYRIPWGITAYNTILAYHLQLDANELPDLVRYLPVYIKHGLDDIHACWSKGFGVPTRESSMKLAKEFDKCNIRGDIETFIKWFVNLTYDELKIIIGSNNYYELNNILNLMQKINSEKFYNKYEQKVYSCYIKGINFSHERINTANLIEINDDLILLREYDNPYDIYAIKIYDNDKEIGYVPRSLAKILAMEMDVNRSVFKGRVISKKQVKVNYSIEIEISKI